MFEIFLADLALLSWSDATLALAVIPDKKHNGRNYDRLVSLSALLGSLMDRPLGAEVNLIAGIQR